MTDELDQVARAFAKARADSARFKTKLAEAQAKVSELRPQVLAAVAEAARNGRSEEDIAAVTGYTKERVRQICRAAGVEPRAEPARPEVRTKHIGRKAMDDDAARALGTTLAALDRAFGDQRKPDTPPRKQQARRSGRGGIVDGPPGPGTSR